MNTATVKRGDRFELALPGCLPVLVRVTRVARDRKWADIWCYDGTDMWTKRQPLPLPANLTPREWTTRDSLRLHHAAVRAAEAPATSGEAGERSDLPKSTSDLGGDR